MEIDNILAGLTGPQLEAVNLNSGVMVAGAGAGKTKTTVAKIAFDQVNRPHLEQIVVTFTNAAAKELKERLKEIGAAEPHFIGTLHALAFRYIRDEWGKVTVITDKQFDAVLKAEMKRTRLNVPVAELKDALTNDSARGNMNLLVRAVLARLRSDRVVHPDMMLRVFNDLLTLKSAGYHGKFFVYVDEAQDSAAIDFAIFSKLAAKDSIFLIGDPRQSIFVFRGARPELFTNAISTYGDGFVVLPHNFRSHRMIVGAANKIAAGMRLPGFPDGMPDMIAARDFVSGKVANHGAFETTEIEAVRVAEWAETDVSSTAILCRYNATVELVATMLRGRGLKVVTSGEPDELDPSLVALSNLAEIPSSWESAMMALGVSFKDAGRLLPLLSAVTDAADIADVVRESFTIDEKDAVVVSTVHAAKGREWDRVALVGADNGAFDPLDEENRRLGYVAATRARFEFVFSFARQRSGRYPVNGLNLSPIFQ